MPDYGYSKDALRAIVGLSGEFVGTTDIQTQTNKTVVLEDNTVKQTTPSLGAILVDNGTKIVARARPAASLPLHGNSGGTDIEYSKLEVAGGGTGLTTATGVIIGTGTTAMTTKSNPAGAFLDDSSAQNVTGAKTFTSTTLKKRNPAGTFTLTEIHPAITADRDTRINIPYTYLVWIEGSTIYIKNGANGGIDFSGTGGTNGTIAIQAALDAMATNGGIIHFCAGIYPIYAQLTIPQHAGKSITIEGEGWRNTRLEWGNTASGTDYVIDSYSTTSAGWQIVTFKDIQLYGGPTTTDRRVKVLRLGRTNSAAVAHYTFWNVRIANGSSPQMTSDFNMDSFLYFLHVEATGASPTPIVDIEVKNSAHLNCFGCYFGAVTVDASAFNAYGGSLQYFENKINPNYVCKISGVFFDPVPIGFTHQVQVGTTGNVVGIDFDNCGFSGDTNTPLTDRYFYINNAKNVYIRNTKFKTGHTLDKTIEFTSLATNCFLYLQSQEDILKVVNSSASTQIYNPYINNTIVINNPSGTSGATLVDSFTSNRIELAQATNHLDCTIKKNSGTPRIRWKSRNAANTADVIRFQSGTNLQDVGTAPLVSFENFTFSGGVSLIPFLKAGAPVDADFITPTNGLVALDITNAAWYARLGGVWTIIGSAGGTLGVSGGGTGAATFTAGILKASGTSAFTTVAAPTGAIMGTTDTQSPTNKTFDSTNTISSATSLPTVTVAKGGTGQTTATLGFDALSPMTAIGDLIVGSTAGTRIALARGAADLPLKVNSGGTNIEYGTLAIAGGGTGNTTATAAFDALSPNTTLGDIAYRGASNNVRLAGNTTAVTQYLSQVGNGTVSAAPTWRTPKSIGVWYLAALAQALHTIIYVTTGNAFTNATEGNVDLIFDYTFTVKRFRVGVQANTKNANTVVSFRDDAADVTGTVITIGAGVTGEQDSGALSVDVAAGSKLNWKIDATANTSGSITLFGQVEYEIALQ